MSDPIPHAPKPAHSGCGCGADTAPGENAYDHAGGEHGHHHPEPAGAGVKDPVCGMTVDRHAGNPTSVFAGRTWHFCGNHCKHRFDEEPELFSSRSPGAASGHPTSHG